MTEANGDSPLVRVCRHCRVQTTSAGEFCSNCGKRYAPRRRPLIPAILVVVIGLCVATSVYLWHRSEVTANSAQSDSETRLSDEDFGEITSRQTTFYTLQNQIFKDAEKRVRAGEFKGPIIAAICSRLVGPSVDSATPGITKFGCVAKRKDGGGYGYVATLNWDADVQSFRPQRTQ